jgi:hypothetical protein
VYSVGTQVANIMAYTMLKDQQMHIYFITDAQQARMYNIYNLKYIKYMCICWSFNMVE